MGRAGPMRAGQSWFLCSALLSCDLGHRLWWHLWPLRWGALHNGQSFLLAEHHDHRHGGIAFLWPPLPDCDRADRLWWHLRPLRAGPMRAGQSWSLWPALLSCDRGQRLWWHLRPLRWGALHNESSGVPQISGVVAGGCSQTHVVCQALASVQHLPLFAMHSTRGLRVLRVLHSSACSGAPKRSEVRQLPDPRGRLHTISASQPGSDVVCWASWGVPCFTVGPKAVGSRCGYWKHFRGLHDVEFMLLSPQRQLLLRG